MAEEQRPPEEVLIEEQESPEVELAEEQESPEAKLDTLEKKFTKESFYDKIPLSKKQLDYIIIFLVAMIIIFIVIGALLGNRII